MCACAYMCVCECLCVRIRETEREREETLLPEKSRSMNVKNSVFSDTVAAWLLLLYSNLILRLCIEEEDVRRALEKVGEEIMIPQKAIKT